LLEASLEGAGGGEFEQAVFGLLDLLQGAAVDVGGVGVVDHVLAEFDQAAAQIEVVEGAAVILRVDDVEGGGRQFREIARSAYIGELRIVLEVAPQRRRRRLLAALDQLRTGVEDAGMNAVAEMLRQQEFGYPLIG